MDQERFDQFTRTLASKQSRRGVLKGLTGTAVGGVLAAVGLRSGDVLAASGEKVGICHRTGNGGYQYISVAQSAVPAHQRHGDVVTNLIDVNNCGTCGNACSAPSNATATCGESGCGFTCDGGYHLNPAGDGCNADVSTCTPDCTGKCGGVSDGCTGTCDATCPSTCKQVDCNIAIENGDGTCWYTPTGVSGVPCNNLYYGVGAGICDTNGNCLPA